MPCLLLLAVLLVPALAPAKTLNVELKFTPFTGDPKYDSVEVVSGTARVLLNNVPVAEQEVATTSRPADRRIKGDEMQMCAGMALARIYPKQLVAVRTPGGTWVVGTEVSRDQTTPAARSRASSASSRPSQST
jgi:hypothetical protein